MAKKSNHRQNRHHHRNHSDPRHFQNSEEDLIRPNAKKKLERGEDQQQQQQKQQPQQKDHDTIELKMRSSNDKSTNNNNDEADESMTRIHPKDNVEDPKFVQRPSDRFVRLGETAKFKCKAAGTRPMEVFWFKMNGDELVNDEKYEIYHDDEFHYLKVYNTMQRDNGMYLCVISNEIEQNVDSFFLRLRGLEIFRFLFLCNS